MIYRALAQVWAAILSCFWVATALAVGYPVQATAMEIQPILHGFASGTDREIFVLPILLFVDILIMVFLGHLSKVPKYTAQLLCAGGALYLGALMYSIFGQQNGQTLSAMELNIVASIALVALILPRYVTFATPVRFKRVGNT